MRLGLKRALAHFVPSQSSPAANAVSARSALRRDGALNPPLWHQVDRSAVTQGTDRRLQRYPVWCQQSRSLRTCHASRTWKLYSSARSFCGYLVVGPLQGPRADSSRAAMRRIPLDLCIRGDSDQSVLRVACARTILCRTSSRARSMPPFWDLD